MPSTLSKRFLCAVGATTFAFACGGSDSGGVTQTPITVATVSVTAPSTSVTTGQTLQLTAVVRDAAANVLTGRSLTWSSSASSVANVNANGLVSALTAGAATITATSEGKSGSIAITVTAPTSASSRSTVDRTDEAVGSQIHFMYVLPSDGVDRGLDTTQTLANTIGSFQNWLGGQTGGRRLRADTYASGKLDITFARLTRTDAAMKSYGVFIRDSLEKLLIASGFSSATKIYAVYYDGGAVNTCGSGPWPPLLPGRVTALYLHGTFDTGAPPCDANPFASSPTAAPGYIDFAMIHEILHALGIVSSVAPNHTLSGHVSTDPTDLMYAGSLPWRPAVLDFNKQNYFNATGLPAGIINLAQSSYMLP